MCKSFVWRSLLTIIVALGPALGASAQTYLDEIEKANGLKLESHGLQMDQISIEEPTLGSHRFSARLSNTSTETRHLALRLRSFQGLSWEPINRFYEFSFQPGEVRNIEAEYEFNFLTPFSRLIVSAYLPDENGQISDAAVRLFGRSIYLGLENPAVPMDFAGLERRSSAHIDAYFLADSLAAKNIETILAQREDAISRILEILGISYDARIKLFLFPDEQSKQPATGHSGLGWAKGNFIAEVYSESEILDPYHELAHTLASKLGSPPAFLDEGFATYISELFGSDALEYLGAPGQKIDAVAAGYAKNNQLFSIADLMQVDNIGSTPVAGAIEYPQSASFVKFLIEDHSFDVFRQLFRELRQGADAESEAHNLRIIQDVTGKPLEEAEADWLRSLMKFH